MVVVVYASALVLQLTVDHLSILLCVGLIQSFIFIYEVLLTSEDHVEALLEHVYSMA